jgi:hypothetical protein
MASRENILRPIHKGIRSMIYSLGLELGITDFTNVSKSNAIAFLLKHDINMASSNCLLCLLYAHSKEEETGIFSAVRSLDEGVFGKMMREHRVITRQVQTLASICDELMVTSDPGRRVELGERLNAEASELFAAYLEHMNHEEAEMIPLMWNHFTDQQLRELRFQYYAQIPQARFEEWMRWMISALNPTELKQLLSSLRDDPPPNRYSDAIRIAKERVSVDRRATIGTDGPS